MNPFDIELSAEQAERMRSELIASPKLSGKAKQAAQAEVNEWLKKTPAFTAEECAATSRELSPDAQLYLIELLITQYDLVRFGRQAMSRSKYSRPGF
jgi:hypothetical protein